MTNDIKSKIILVVYIFFLLFAPPIIKSINPLLILFVFSLITILTKYRNELFIFIKNKSFLKPLKLLILYFFWYFITIILNIIFTKKVYLYNYFINIYSMALVVLCLFICCLHIYFYSRKKNIQIDDIIKLTIYAGLIQSTITIISFLFPIVKEFLVNIMYKNTGDDLYLNKWATQRRFFGFANNMLDSFGYGTGIIAILPLFYSIKYGKKWILTVPLLLVVPFLNSRTGLVIFGLGLICWIFYLFKEKKIVNYLKLFGIVGIIVGIFIFVIYKFAPTTIDWIIRDFSSFFTDKKGTADQLLSNDFWRFPSLINLIFGAGYNVAVFGGMTSLIGFHSDVGYINELWKTGIVGFILLLIALLSIIYVIYNNVDKKNKYLIVFILFATLISHIKFYVFSYNPGIVIIILLFIFSVEEKAKVKITTNMEIQLKEKVSVVVPIYKVEQYLRKCVDSIINQTYKNLEIILVDDGSPDDCGKICEEYASKDTRIKVLHKINGGLSDARNFGLDVATGEYICFIDSDDFVNEYYVEKMLESALKNNSDICACNFEYIDESGKTWIRKEKEENVYSSSEAIKDIFTLEQNTEVMVWNKLYKRSLFVDNNIKYPVGRIHEDNFTTYKLYDKANRVSLINDKLYYYLQRGNSIMSTFNQKRFDILIAIEEIKEYFKDRNGFTSSIQCNELLIYLSLINNMIKSNYNGKEKLEVVDKIRKNKRVFLKNKIIPLQKKIMILILLTNVSLYSKLFVMLKR